MLTVNRGRHQSAELAQRQLELPTALPPLHVENLQRHMCPHCRQMVQSIIEDYEYKLYVSNSAVQPAPVHDAQGDRQYQQEILYLQQQLQLSRPDIAAVQNELATQRRITRSQRYQFQQQLLRQEQQFQKQATELKQQLSLSYHRNDELTSQVHQYQQQVDALAIVNAEALQCQRRIKALEQQQAEQSRRHEQEVAGLNATILHYQQCEQAMREFEAKQHEMRLMAEQCKRQATVIQQLEVELERAKQHQCEASQVIGRQADSYGQLQRRYQQLLSQHERQSAARESPALTSCPGSARSTAASYDLSADFSFDFCTKQGQQPALELFLKENRPKYAQIDFEVVQRVPKFLLASSFRKLRADLLTKQNCRYFGVAEPIISELSSRRVQKAVLAFLEKTGDAEESVQLFGLTDECIRALTAVVLSGYDIVDRGDRVAFRGAGGQLFYV